jgi:hypothetical protein
VARNGGRGRITETHAIAVPTSCARSETCYLHRICMPRNIIDTFPSVNLEKLSKSHIPDKLT